MILRNWINKIIGGNGTETFFRVTDTYGRSRTSGLYFRPSTDIYADNYVEITETPGDTFGIGLAIGTGTTPPTINDYKMENAITKNLNAGGVSRSFNANTTNSSLTVTQPIVNLGTDAITISEIGLFGRSQASTTSGCLLFTRDIIEPVTIAPNETKTFVVSIDFTQMSTSASAS